MTVAVHKLRNHPSGAMLMVLQFAALFQMAQFSFTANNQCKDRMLSLLFNDTCYELTQLEWCHSDNTINNSKCTEIVQRQHVCAQPRNSDEDVNYTMACDSGYELLTQDGYLIEGAQVDICVNVSWKTDFNVSIRDHSCFTRNDTDTILDGTSDSTSITLTLVQLFETRNSNCGYQSTQCVLYSAYCQAHHSHVQHGTNHQCYSNSTNCTIAITELQPNTTYQCCLHDMIISEESLHCINISTKFKVTNKRSTMRAVAPTDLSDVGCNSVVVTYILGIVCGVLGLACFTLLGVMAFTYTHNNRSNTSESSNEEVVDTPIYETVDEAKDKIHNGPYILPSEKDVMKRNVSYKFVVPRTMKLDKLTESDQTAHKEVNREDTSTSEDSNYQPLVPLRAVNADQYQCLSPVEEQHPVLGLPVEHETRNAGIAEADKEGTKDTYQSLIEESQVCSESQDYQSLAEFT